MSYDPLLFNVDPYYDDYSEDKKFLRMLFRPGYAVQARELTQLQTILQNQIEKFGKNIFNEGSLVYGGEVVENRVKFARVSGLTGTQDITDLIGGEISSSYSGGRILHAETALANSTSDTRPVVFFEYTSGGTAFASGNTIGGTATNSASFSFTIGGITAGSITGQAIGDALLVSVAPGIRFIEGFFVSNDKQTIAAHTLTGATGSKVRLFETPTTRVGFSVDKQIITDSDDTTLRDPSYGFYNYAAPGADRFKIDLPLTQYGYSATEDLSTVTTDNFSRENFIEFIRIVNGNVIKREQYPDYSVLGDTLARRTYDESGNYTVEPFQITVTDSVYGSTGATFSLVVSPGKAYVFGYEFETIGNTRLDLPKTRTTKNIEDANIQSVVGPYVLSSLTGNAFPTNGFTGFDLATMPTAYLSSSRGMTGASAFAQVGTAKVRGIQYVGGYGDKNWRVDLFDVSLSSGSKFSDVKSLFVDGKTGTGQQLVDFYSPTGGAELQDFTNTLLFPLSAGNGIKTVTDADYKVRFAKKVSFSATGSASISTNDIGLGTDVNLAKFDYGTLVNAPDNTFIVINENGDSVSASATTGAAANTLVVTNGPNGATGTVIGEARLLYNSGSYVRRGKTVVQETLSITGSTLTDVGPTGATNGAEYRLLNKKIDVFEISAITGASGQSFNSYFVLDTGNRDNYYDWSRLVFAPGFSSGSTAGLTGTLSVTVRRFDRTGATGAAGPFTVDSYSGVAFGDIPVYTSPDTGNTYRLSDLFDFRPDRQTDGTFSPFCYPVSTSTGLVSVDRYLPRTDKLVLTRDKTFKLVSGLPSLEGAVPPDQPNAMTLYTLSLPPYAYSKDDVSIRAIKNKRYTMQDIGNLERRIDSVEYYTTMSLLEQEAKNTAIVDTDGVEVPKKGILVDTFRGHNVGDVKDTMYNAAVDPEGSLLRPAFKTKVYRLSLDSNATPSQYNYSPASIPLSITGNRLFTMGYTGVAGVVQIQASTSRQLNPFGIINYTGTLFTNPDSDFWFADTQRPSVRVNPRGEKDNWAFSVRGGAGAEGGTGAGEGTGFGTQWNDWETMWFGKSNFDETNNQIFNKTIEDMSVSANMNAFKNSILDRNASPESIVMNKSSEKTNSDVEFYARNIEVLVRGDGLKPNTKLYAFIDDSTTPATIVTTTQSLTASTDTGTTGYVMTDSKGSFGGTTAGSSGYAIYLNQTGNLKTGARLIRFCDSNTNDITTTTTVAEKIFPIEGSYGIKETETVSTRKPIIKRASPSSSTIVNDIFAKETSTTAASRGIVEPLSQSFFVDPVIYPYGVFVSSVDLWFKSKDSANVPVTLELKNMLNGFPHPSKTLPTGVSTVFSSGISVSDDASSSTRFGFGSPIYLNPGVEYCFSLRTTSDKFSLHSAILNQTQYQESESDPVLSVTKQPYVRSLFTAQSQNTLLKETREDLKFVVNFCKFDRNTASIIQTKNVPTSYYGASVNPSIVRVEVPTITPPGTSITVQEYGQGILGTDTDIVVGKNLKRAKADSVNPTANFTTLRFNMSSTNDYVSPVVDLDRSCIILVEDQVNNNKVGTTDSNGEQSPNNRGVSSSVRSASRYITKKINLENPAIQLDVYLKISNPPTTGVEVFAKTLPDETDSNTTFSNRGYQKMTASTERNTAEGEYQDIRYTLTLTEDQRFSTFAIKVVMYGDKTNANHPVPLISSMKVIAT